MLPGKFFTISFSLLDKLILIKVITNGHSLSQFRPLVAFD